MIGQVTSAALVILVTLTGCGGLPEPEPPVLEVPLVRTPADLAELKLPLDEYIETPESRQNADRAINILGRECMRRFGLEWPVIQADFEPGRPRHARRYGIPDAQYGYHPPPPPPEVPTPDHWSSLSPEQAAVWVGQGQPTVGGPQVPDGGCAAEAMRILLEGAPSVPALQPQQLANQTLNLAMQDSRVQVVFGQWSECLRREGLNYRSPWDINDDPRWQQTPQPSGPELAAAQVDIDCRRAVNLVGVWFAVEKSYQQRIVGQHAEDFARLRRVITVQNEAATRIVG